MPTQTQLVPPTSAKHHRFLLLDALRGLAALFVVAWHFPAVYATTHFNSNGLLAVDFFFCLSGFVIAFSYEKRLTESFTFKTFSIARLIRLYPMYILGTAIGFAIQAVHNHIFAHGLPSFGWSQFMVFALLMLPARLQGPFNDINYPFDGPAWSLFYELAANFAYAILVKLRAAHTAVIALICVVSLFFLARAQYLYQTIDVGFYTIHFAYGFARVGFSFFAGVLLYRLYRFRTHIAPTQAPQTLAAILVTLGLIAIFIAPLHAMQTNVFRLVAIAVLFPTLVYIGAFARLPHHLAPLCAVLGEVSYPLYLLHRPLISPFYSKTAQHIAISHPALMHILVPTTVLALAVVAYYAAKHIDAPIRRFLTHRYNKPIAPVQAIAI